MPRLAPSLVQRARRISPLAAVLLPACRDLPSALNELRWIREQVSSRRTETDAASAAEQRLWRLCRRRGRGEPLQYVLGTQPFGDLEIKCRKGVLIPRFALPPTDHPLGAARLMRRRPEPEAYTLHLAYLLRERLLPVAADSGGPPTLRVLDLCTGTGCIALLLYSLLRPLFPSLHVAGLDVSPDAVRLARENAAHNRLGSVPGGTASQTVGFLRGDMFDDDWLPAFLPAARDGPGTPAARGRMVDVLTCNPPYISLRGFARDTARSVRNYEPRLAQVPLPRAGYDGRCASEDVFYARLLDLGQKLGPRVLLCEVGGLEQARRVVDMALRHPFSRRAAVVEIWADSPDVKREAGETASVVVGGREIPIRGSGHGRSVFIACGDEGTST